MGIIDIKITNKRIFMYKNTFVLVTALVLFSGCGGGSSSSSQKPLTVNSVQDNTTAIAQSLRDAGYTNASNVANIATDVITFTYLRSGKKHFVVYNNKTSEILSDIPSFIGDTISTKTKDSVSFNNGTTVNVSNYKKPTVTSKPVTANSNNHNNNKLSTKEIILKTIRQQSGGSETVADYTYTYSKQGMLALTFNDRDEHTLYVFGLSDGKPYYEKKYTKIDAADYAGRLTPLDHGRVKIAYGYDSDYTLIYNYIDGYVVSYYSPDDNNNYDNDNNRQDYYSTPNLVDQFKNDIDNFKWFYVTHAVSPQGHGAVVLAQSDDGGSVIYLYGISDGIATREKRLVDEYGSISDLRMLSGGRFSYKIHGRTVVASYL